MEEGLGGSMEIPLLSAREPVIPASKAEHNVVEQVSLFLRIHSLCTSPILLKLDRQSRGMN